MKTFYVTQQEIHVATYEVQAESKEEALEVFRGNFNNETENVKLIDTEYSDIIDGSEKVEYEK